MNNKWLVVNVASSRGAPSLRKVVASFATLTECESFINESQLVKGDLVIRGGLEK
jgi:hypothetical protein